MAESDNEAPGDEDGLYVVAPDQFIAARDALVRRLRSGGAKAEAAQVAKRRRPPLTAWALNQVARTAPGLIDALMVAGSKFRGATEDALAGDASGLRPARTAERSAVDAVVAEAVRRLEQGGHAVTDVMRPRMAATLRAAVVDEAVADRLRQGVLERDLEAPGFGMDALAPAPPPLITEEPRTDDVEARARAERLREAQAEARRRAAEAAELVADADRLAAEAIQASERATEARTRADAALRVAAQAADRAEALTRE